MRTEYAAPSHAGLYQSSTKNMSCDTWRGKDCRAGGPPRFFREILLTPLRALVQCWTYSFSAFSPSAFSTMSEMLFRISSANVCSRNVIIFFIHRPSLSQPVKLRCCGSMKQALTVALSPYMGQGRMLQPLWVLSWCTASPALASSSADTWAIAQSLWPACPCQTTFYNGIIEECQTRCSWLTDTQWCKLAMCSSPLSVEGIFCPDPDAESGPLSQSYWHNARFPWKMQDVGRISKIQDGRLLVLEDFLVSCFCGHLVWESKVEPCSNRGELHFRSITKCASKIYDHEPQATSCLHKAEVCPLHIPLLNIVFWAKPTLLRVVWEGSGEDVYFIRDALHLQCTEELLERDIEEPELFLFCTC